MSKRKQQKTGAIELSITTIIVVVLGVTLLSLGLVFVRGIFTKLTTTSDEVFGKANTLIGSLDIEGRFSAPSEVDVPQSGTTTFDIIIGNDGTIGSANFDVRLTPSSDSGVPESQVRAKIISEHPRQIAPGQQGRFKVQVIATSDAPLSIGNNVQAYALTITADGKPYETSAFLIKVVKPKSIF